MKNKNFPIYGCFTSKRGTFWNYKIYEDLTVEQWHQSCKNALVATDLVKIFTVRKSQGNAQNT